MKKTLILWLSPLLLSASLFDFMSLDKAQESYAEGNYTQAIQAYESLKEKSDEVLYDEANSHYKLKEYEKAKVLYESIAKTSLLFNKWHNLGNCNAQLNKIDEGIKAYEEALKIKEDADTRFNLELLKKKKKEEQKKKQDKKDDKKDDKKNDKDKKNEDKNKEQKKSDKDKKDQDDKEKSPEEKKKEEEQKRKEQEKQKKEDAKKEKEKDKSKDEQKQQQAQAPMKKEPISDKELRKYQQMLDKRGISTLLVPLETKGEENHEFKPW